MSRKTSNRHDQILARLGDHGDLDMAALRQMLGVSEATVRRDLRFMETQGKLIRTFGGARKPAEPSLVAATFGEKREKMRDAKERMARAAAAMVQPGMRVLLDSGTTIWRVAAALKQTKPLTVITCSHALIDELGSAEGITIFCVGGRFRRSNLDFCGEQTVSALGGFRADIAFLGADSLIPGRGLYATDPDSAVITQAIGQCADCRVVVADHTKINRNGFLLALRCERIDVVITDAGISDEVRKQLEADAYKLKVV
jgi:DeoR family transcriptional regulator of aga operon